MVTSASSRLRSRRSCKDGSAASCPTASRRGCTGPWLSPARPTTDGMDLPAGPVLPPSAQALAFARDPLGVLVRTRARYGPVFTMRFAGLGPIVVVASPAAVETLVPSDPAG